MKIDSAKKWTKRIVAALVFAAAVGAFFGLPSNAVLRIQPAVSWAFVVVLLLTPLLGRLFCECFCPLGIVQSFVNWLFHPRTHVRRVCTRLPQGGAQLAVRWTVFAVFAALLFAGFGAVAWIIGPYSIFGKAITLFAPGVVVFAVVVALAAAGKGRTWCNWICPAGTLFSSLSVKSVCRHKVGEGCANCRACFPGKADGSKAEKGKGSDGDVGRREVLKGVAVIAAVDAVEKTTDGGFAEVSLPLVPKRPATVLPPGAISRARFNTVCVACGRCIEACPSGILRQSISLMSLGQPELFFQNDYCRAACGYKCARACPVGALVPGDPANKRHFHIGVARLEKSMCIRGTDGVECKACSKKCPVDAISIVDGFPKVNPRLCVGCGACEHVCAARPEPAIRVEPLPVQREEKPRSDDALVAEMKEMLSGGASCVVARGGFVAESETGRGIGPILRLLDAGRLDGATVADKVIGRAAAAVCVLGGARRVHATLMSEDAKAFLEVHGVAPTADEFVPRIQNREKTGHCPMELAVEGETYPAEMVKRIRAKLAELRGKSAAK